MYIYRFKNSRLHRLHVYNQSYHEVTKTAVVYTAVYTSTFCVYTAHFSSSDEGTMIVMEFGVPPKEALPVIERMTNELASSLYEITTREVKYPGAICSALIAIVLRMVRDQPQLARPIKAAIDEAAGIH